METSNHPIIVEQNFDVPVNELWCAITDPGQMRQWFFEVIEAFEPKVGFETRFVIENEGRIFPHLWKIVAVVSLEKIVYQWRYEGYNGDSIVSFELYDLGQSSQLRVVHTITHPFPEDIPEFKRESCRNGWNYFIKQRLKSYMQAKI